MEEVPMKTVCKRIDTDSGSRLYLLLKWWSDSKFDIDATDGAAAWRAVDCTCPSSTSVGPETWMEKAREALGFREAATPFEFESFLEDDNGDARELRWYWPMADAGLRGKGHVVLSPAELGPCLSAFLSTACDLSSLMSVMTVENREAQRGIEQDMQALKQEVREATHSRRMLYTRCAALFNEKKREVEEKEREISELRARLNERMDVEEHYSDETA